MFVVCCTVASMIQANVSSHQDLRVSARVVCWISAPPNNRMSAIRFHGRISIIMPTRQLYELPHLRNIMPHCKPLSDRPQNHQGPCLPFMKASVTVLSGSCVSLFNIHASSHIISSAHIVNETNAFVFIHRRIYRLACICYLEHLHIIVS